MKRLVPTRIPFLSLAAWTAATSIAVASSVDARAISHPRIPLLDAAAMTSGCDEALASLRAMQAAMEAKRGPAGVFDEWNRLSLAQSDISGPAAILANVSTDKAVRDASDACALKLQPFETELFQSEALYKRVKDAKPVDAIQAQYRQDLIDAFEDTGVTLPPDKRARVKEINQRITDLALQFEKSLRDDDTRIVMTPAEMAGVPDAYLAAQTRDADGNYRLSLAYPVYGPFMQSATNADARRRFYVAELSRGGQGNIDLLNQAVALRLELARLYGDPDFATFALRRRMAGNPAAVRSFLDEVKRAVGGLEQREVRELADLKADDLKQPRDATRLERWDVLYYQEKLKQARFDVDQEALRKYFPSDASVAYTLRVAETLYRIRFVPSPVPTWHPDVKVFDVFEATKPEAANDAAKRGAFIGTVYLDLYPRDGKFTHAAAWPVRPTSVLAKESRPPGYHTPISVLVTNLDRAGLNHDELETLLHEFGHVLHGVLSKARYADQAGTSVKRDFVEAPSQMFEEWARREDALKLFADVCRECPRLTSTQIAKIDAARKYGRGIRYARQVLFADYDLSLTTPNPDDALVSWRRMEAATPLGTVPDTMFPASFAHIISGYSAGYYGYMWSEVLALDMLSGFHGQLMNPVDGKRYRDDILSQGGQRPASQLVEHFLGRKPSSDAFFKEVVGER